jgi:hypothetical protein
MGQKCTCDLLLPLLCHVAQFLRGEENTDQVTLLIILGNLPQVNRLFSFDCEVKISCYFFEKFRQKSTYLPGIYFPFEN